MKDFEMVEKDAVLRTLAEGKEVQAIILENRTTLTKGENYIKSGVYNLDNSKSVRDINIFLEKDNVVFYIRKEA